MSEPSRQITIEPTPEFFEADKVMCRAWRGTASDGTSVVALVAGVQMDRAMVEESPLLRHIPPPVASWSPIMNQVMGNIWKIAERLNDQEAGELMAWVIARAGYRDPSCIEQKCDQCEKPYRGPAMYCSLACAVAAA